MPLPQRRQADSFGSDAYGYDDADNADYNDPSNSDEAVSWWWTPAGMTLRYAIVALLFALVLFYFVGGYWHARRRIRKGLAPLPYHRWMVRRRTTAYNRPPYNNHNRPTYNAQYQQQGQQEYMMQSYPTAGVVGAEMGGGGIGGGYAAPPPAYNPHEAPPPVYQPPEGGSKVLADQGFGGGAVGGGRQ